MSDPTPSPSSSSILTRGFILILLALATVRLYIIQSAQLFPDEALYYFLSQRAQSNFCPHPPGTPLLSSLGTALLGKSELGLRLGSFLLGLATLFPLAGLARHLGGSVAAKWSFIALAATPLFVMAGAICTPDGAQLFFYTLALYFTWHALNSGRWWQWALAGLVVGIGLYIKYIIILYFPALLLCLLVAPAYRRHLLSPGPYLAALVAALVFVPVFISSEMANGWPALRYHLSRRQRYLSPDISEIAKYQLAHIGYYSPLLYGLYLYAMFTLAMRAVKLKDSVAAFLASFALVPWALFAMIAAVTQRELSREQWDAIAYIPALLGVGVLLARRAEAAPLPFRWPRLHRWAVGLGLLIIAVVTFEGGTGLITNAIGRKPLFSNLSGWNAMAAEADKLLAELPEPATGQKLLIGDSFAPTLQYFFYSKHPVKPVSIWSRRNEKYGLEVVLEASGAGQDELQNEMGSNAIFVMEVDPRDPHKKEIENRRVELNHMFTTVETGPRIVINKGGQPVKAFQFYRCIGLRYFRHQG